MGREQGRASLKHQGEDECQSDADRGDEPDQEGVVPVQARQHPGPGVVRIGIGPQPGQGLGHVYRKFMGRRVWTGVVAGAALEAQVGQIDEILGVESAPALHGREHRAEALAVPAGVADGHDPIGFLEVLRRWHARPPFRQCGRIPFQWSCRTLPDSLCRGCFPTSSPRPRRYSETARPRRTGPVPACSR